MSDARADILSRIQRANGRGPLRSRQRAPLEQRLKGHLRNLVPARTDLEPGALVDLFVTMAEAANASVARVSGMDDVPDAVHGFLREHNLPARVTASPERALEGVEWSQAPVLEVEIGRPDPGTTLNGVTGAQAGIAETGTVMLVSGNDRPTQMNFLPDNHIVILRASQVVGPYEDGWDGLREEMGPEGLPRTVNFVTGPSRTGDIEQKLQLGAHGPRRLHIILVEDGG